MSEPLFDIVFRGDLVPGHRLPDVKARLAQLFKIDATRVDALFAGTVVALKRNLDQPTAAKYETVLRQAGAAVELRSVTESVPAPRERRLTLAPLGTLLGAGEGPAVRAPVPDLSDYSIRPMEGHLLDEAEKTTSPPMPELNIDFELAPVGADLLEPTTAVDKGLEINPRFELADLGEDLLKPEERTQRERIEVRTDHISLA